MGARSNADGIDTAGIFCAPGGAATNVETNELAYPQLYMYRKEETDTGGPGQNRGGVTASLCWLPHDTEGMGHVISAFGAAVPQSEGICGEYPSNSVRYELVRGSNTREILDGGTIPSDGSEIAGEREAIPPKAAFEQGPDDVYYSIWQGGGGFGDPLDREPERVAEDVRTGYVSPEEARRTYGIVVTDGGNVDDEATEARREEIREERLSASSWGGD